MYPKVYAIVFMAVSLFMSCADKITSNCENSDTNRPSAATFSSIQKNILEKHCALSGCHEGASPAESLNLEAGSAYGDLVTVKSQQDPSLMRVLPNSSQQSYLFIKMTMPPDQSIMPPTGKLDQAITDTVAAWIDHGALNN